MLQTENHKTLASRRVRPFNAPTEEDAFHRALAHANRRRLAAGEPSSQWRAEEREQAQIRLIEGKFIERQREKVSELARAAPRDPKGFIAWFRSLEETGPGQRDALFPWLARDADLQSMRWFLTQEIAGEAGFDDLVAMTQIKLPTRPKLELARNYWDEMGRGNAPGMHGPMLAELAEALDLRPEIECTLWPSLALANTLLALASTRRYVYHSIGALGAVELTAPRRSAHVDAGLKRLGVQQRRYFALHAVLDVKHSESWNEEAIAPLIAENPRAAQYIAEGALMRLECGAACFEAYRKHLWRH